MSQYLIIAVCLVLGACSTPPIVEGQIGPIAVSVELHTADRIEADRLNVTVIAFDPGLDSADGRISQFHRLLRDAEAGYMPVVLRNTLVESQHWGAVRVLPRVDPTAEVMVTAQILASDSVELRLAVRVVDSRGVLWLDKQYFDTATDHGYDPKQLGMDDPFQDLFNEIANDMYRVRKELTGVELSGIFDISTLRYAIALSPEVFESYLEHSENGVVEMSGLPARDDRMYLRVKKIRDTEYRFIDTMDEQFNRFYQKMQSAYPFWRQYSFELMVYNQELAQTGSVTRHRTTNIWRRFEDGYRTYKEYKLNEDALRELAVSLDSEIKPTVAEYEGNVIELSGSLNAQYAQWRKILRKIYAVERE